MATSTTRTGDCPNCGSTIPDHSVIIEYRRNDRPTSYAECPRCRSVVNPVCGR